MKKRRLPVPRIEVYTCDESFTVYPIHDPELCKLPGERGIVPECSGCQYLQLQEWLLDLYRPEVADAGGMGEDLRDAPR